jgi:hypothetical protein
MDVDVIATREATPRVMVARFSDIARSHTLRCDARQWERRFRLLDEYFLDIDCFELGEVLPAKLVKGTQPTYVEGVDAVGTPVISTMAIRDLRIDSEACRVAQDVDFGPDDVKKPRRGDVLLTVDGGTSIGKPTLFELDDEYAIDSHVAILRPVGLSAELLVYLLASPLGQVQFQRAESGASGQTSVSDEDIRRFRFPRLDAESIDGAVTMIRDARAKARALWEQATVVERAGWDGFVELLTGKGTNSD